MQLFSGVHSSVRSCACAKPLSMIQSGQAQHLQSGDARLIRERLKAGKIFERKFVYVAILLDGQEGGGAVQQTTNFITITININIFMLDMLLMLEDTIGSAS
ncbi:hypothetical protein HAX54_012758 [Datura stramonium]|uniref:Uncharacterized protein n=1 Tax=Datura stramonium TaxID=4076 RepID=A0ABS8RYC3_DATST|nr:hypothetical protein [Datura stramonium]